MVSFDPAKRPKIWSAPANEIVILFKIAWPRTPKVIVASAEKSEKRVVNNVKVFFPVFPVVYPISHPFISKIRFVRDTIILWSFLARQFYSPSVAHLCKIASKYSIDITVLCNIAPTSIEPAGLKHLLQVTPGHSSKRIAGYTLSTRFSWKSK
jgi:hypothetical protein